MNERYETLKKKYMCKWEPEVAMSICGYRLKHEGFEPNAVECLICLGETFKRSCLCAWEIAAISGTGKLSTRVMQEFENFIKHMIAFETFVEIAKPGWNKSTQDEWADRVEMLLEERAKIQAERINVGT